MSTVILMVGVAGSGKSSYANHLLDTLEGYIEVISTDQLRGEYGSGEDDQSVSRIAFLEAERRLIQALTSRVDYAIIDATNLTRKSRKRFINIARQFGYDVSAYCMVTPLKECIFRNERRSRKVPGHIIVNQYQRIKFPEVDEVDHVFYIKPD
jgi:predicted kinase